MERYLVFCSSCEPSGGQDDMLGDYATLEEALEAIQGETYIWWYSILDIDERKWVFPEDVIVRWGNS